MKTSVIMSRDMNGVSIRQDSKTEFFNANDLLNIYNEEFGSDKRIDHYMENRSTKETIAAILKDLHNTRDSGDFENGVIESKRGKNGGTWMHPYLFIDFGMWLSPEFKVTVLKWVYDNLVRFRNQCGDGFKEVNDALFEQKPNLSPFEYANEARMINKLVFGVPDKGQRNGATEDQLSLLKAMQRADVKLIASEMDYYERYEKLKEVKNLFLLTK
jgi:hypothetical protein